MSELGQLEVEEDRIYIQAAEWLTQLGDSNPSADLILQWQRWMSADVRHTKVFDDLEETWERLGEIATPNLLPADKLAEDAYDGSSAVSRFRATNTHGLISINAPRAARRINRVPRLAFAAGVILAVVSIAALVGTELRAPSSRPAVLETAIGENKVVMLADGSKIALSGATQLEVKLLPRRRELTLTRGEALFTVAADVQRPFSVRAGNAMVTALGTEFDVRRNGDRTEVSVIGGRVLLQPDTFPMLQLIASRESVTKHKARALEAGQHSVLDKAGVESTAPLPDPQSASAWQEGRLVFQREPLKYVLEDVNRYATKPIVLADESVGALKFTGTVASGNLAGWVASLDPAFGIEATQENDRIILKRKR